ncbi:Pisatin demethylase [Dichotomopilus funicola]|uniref:Pisatin demethylase n=1 Tax=Dichotomopilus funicola TaxID=1934379 RepID=A0AAN6ZN21_9PEZI|nr:Pisatin demethylase [Dichotomopilus funicola]
MGVLGQTKTTPTTTNPLTAANSQSLFTLTLTLLTTHWPLLLLTTLLLRALLRRYLSPLRKYPGPALASITRLWKAASTASGRSHHHYIALHRKYNSRVIRIAPNEVSVSSPEAARVLLSAGKGFVKTPFYWVFPPPENPDIFTETREDVHAVKKRVANGPYAMAAMQQLSPFIDDTVDVLMGKIKEGYISSPGSQGGLPGQQKRRAVFNLGEYLHYFAFDVLGEVGFSRTFGFLREGRDVDGAIRAIDQSQTYNGLVGQIPELDYLLRRNPLWRLVPWLSNKNALITRMAREELVRRQPFGKDSDGGLLRTGDGRRDLMASLILGHLKDPQKFGEGDVFAVAHGAIFAGSDSTASTMQSFFWHIFSSPQIYQALTHEIQTAVTTGTIPATGNLTWTQSQGLPYLQACLKEAMRLRPAVGLNMTRLVPPEGAELDGEFFPGGTSVACNGWVVHRDRETFGVDAGEFRPERWLESEERAKRMERYMVHFGGGSHLCLGRNLALLEINKVVPRLLRDYRFELVHPGRPLTENASFFVVQSGLEVYVTKA